MEVIPSLARMVGWMALVGSISLADAVVCVDDDDADADCC